MPGFYPEGEYDLAGFIVGVGRSRQASSPAKTSSLATCSSGCPPTACTPTATRWPASCSSKSPDTRPRSYVNEIKNKVGNELMRTHRSYWPIIQKHGRRRVRHGDGPHHRRRHHRKPAAHAAERHGGSVELGSWPVLPIFDTCRSSATSPQEEMLRTFNMGIGMLLVVPAEEFKKAQTLLERAGEKFYTIGRIVKGERKVMFS